MKHTENERAFDQSKIVHTCALFCNCSGFPMFLPSLKVRPLNETPKSYFVLQYGSGPSSAFTSKLLHVRAPPTFFGGGG